MTSLPISNCRLPIEEWRSSIGFDDSIESKASTEMKADNRKLAIGNRQ